MQKSNGLEDVIFRRAVPALTKDGRRVSIEFSVVLLKSPNGGVASIAAILQDVTQRWERDKVLRQQLAAAKAKF